MGRRKEISVFSHWREVCSEHAFCVYAGNSKPTDAMAMTLNPRHLKRYAQIARLLAKYGRSDLVRQSGLDSVLEGEPTAALDNAPEAEELAADLESMGPTFTKLGQLMSSRVDMIPAVYIEALSRLQQSVQPFDFAEVQVILEEELGMKLSRAFREFDPEPVAAASLGQVHRAVLPSGREVAVKVQRPGIREQVVEDFEVLGELAAFADAHTEAGKRYRFSGTLAEMRRAFLIELDYRKEAVNLRMLGDNLAEFERVIVPCTVAGYVTGRVLTMDFVRGTNITKLGPLRRMELDGAELADQLFQAYLKQVLVDGFFHADPHPGNVFLTEENSIALIDVGMVGKLPPELQERMLKMLLAMSEGRGRDTADSAIEMGDATELFDEDGFREEIGRQVLDLYTGASEDLQIGRAVMNLTKAAGDNGLIIPPQLTMLGKTLLNLDLVGRTLDPGFDPNAAIRKNATDLMQRRMLKSASPGNILSSLLETNEFVQRLPGRLNRVFDALGDGELEVRIKVANDTLLLDGLQKIANRIAAGAVLAALIVAAAMLMRVETSFRIMGYPGLAMLLFMIAGTGAVMLLADVISRDRQAKRKTDRK